MCDVQDFLRIDETSRNDKNITGYLPWVTQTALFRGSTLQQ